VGTLKRLCVFTPYGLVIRARIYTRRGIEGLFELKDGAFRLRAKFQSLLLARVHTGMHSLVANIRRLRFIPRDFGFSTCEGGGSTCRTDRTLRTTDSKLEIITEPGWRSAWLAVVTSPNGDFRQVHLERRIEVKDSVPGVAEDYSFQPAFEQPSPARGLEDNAYGMPIWAFRHDSALSCRGN
jgi:hypothetical protein